jgi:hypothetical protein
MRQRITNIVQAYKEGIILFNISLLNPKRTQNRCHAEVHETVKRKFVPLHAMKAYRGISSIAPLILNFGTRWWLVVSFLFRPLYPREITLVAIE